MSAVPSKRKFPKWIGLRSYSDGTYGLVFVSDDDTADEYMLPSWKAIDDINRTISSQLEMRIN